METLYKPEGVEERWEQIWEQEGLYNADPDPTRESFVIAHPPPNVTGDLHMGHALQLSLADTIVRTRRMQGYNTLFQPGFDHAGISTQNAVEKHLAQEGRTRQDLGREAFVALVWDWLREYGGKIMLQFRRIGASMDYRRERFTMDDAYVRAVMRFFVHLYGKGWIYRANRIINWCPFHQTSLSDLEVARVEVDDALTYVRYPLADGDGQWHAVQRAFHAEHGLQCGFCTPGMVMAAVSLLAENPDPTEEQVRTGLEGNICRCTGYHNIVLAIAEGAAIMRGEAPAPNPHGVAAE